MAISQENRLLQLTTPLDSDFLLLSSFRGIEGISTLFRFDLEIVHEETDSEYKPTVVDINKVLGKQFSVRILQRDKTERFFSGIVNRFSQRQRDKRFTYYQATIVPQFWLLTQSSQSRIFQHLSVPDILKDVMSGLDVSFELTGTYLPREYCVQYRETDFNFASRLMEEEGIYYYFEHHKNSHRMIISDSVQWHRECPTKSEIPFALRVEDEEDFASSVGTFSVNYELRSGKTTLRDHSFELPHQHLEVERNTRFGVADSQQLEIYDYPGGYSYHYSGIDRSGKEQHGKLQKVFEEGRHIIELRRQELDANFKIIEGSSECASFTAGYRFKLLNHPDSHQNQLYVLTLVSHEAIQSPSYISNEEGGRAYDNRFTCIPYGAGKHPPYRPPRITPKPLIQGSQTAVVVGPKGEEIFTDKYGRVKVRFHWDRANHANDDYSCWLRVAQNQAGFRWGAFYLPRVGQEVVVDFLEGNPDRPLITGSVYNATELPPYKLPAEKTKTVIFKSSSYKGGDGFNELRIEDKKGEEQIFIHAERNKDVRVKNDRFETIEHNTNLIVGGNQLEKVTGDKHLEINGAQMEKVNGTISRTAGADIQECAGIKYAMEASKEIHLKSGMNLVLESGTTLTLKVGGNFININSSGIYLSGNMVFLNSGGAAGTGAGSSPETPKKPFEADGASTGNVSQFMPTPPRKPIKYSPAALAMKKAAKTGMPFCEICSRLAK